MINHDDVILKNKKIVILMATFNGELFIKDQVKSIQDQTFENWQLLIRDDGSSDSTADIIRNFSNSDPRIKIIHRQGENIGVIKNFECLLKTAQNNNDEYIAFCDQDDFWKPEKLQKQFLEMKKMEARYGQNMPILLFTDLQVTNSNLEIQNSSFMNFQGISNAENISLGHLLKQNIVVGNTIMINKALLEIALPFPENIHMHDWWLALCAASFGIIKYLPCQTVLYRLHEKNQVGAAGIGVVLNPFNFKWLQTLKKMNKIFLSSFQQTILLKKRLLFTVKDRYKNHLHSKKLAHSINLVDHHIDLLLSNLIFRFWLFLTTREKCPTKILSILFAFQLLNPVLVKKARDMSAVD
jgi:glycosyltransferase involved in cell wall biosynthesis